MLKVPTKKYANSSFVIIEIADSFLLQKRDRKDSIWYPSMLGLFGGKIEEKEDEYQALKREVIEETKISLKKIFFLNSFQIKKGNEFYVRYVFYTKLKKLPNNFKVFEGRGYLLVKREKLHSLKKNIIPTDYVSLSNYLRLKYNHYLP
tara:strand:+ start:98 stop:541 length:444 start_codon:yes stop_codon:yes gene_type:complete